MSVTLLHGDSLELLKTLPDCSVDSVVTDPPYELGFMGKAWDASGIAYNVDLWTECLRVLKPGGHLLAFGGTRTYHRMAVAIEDAGFEIRDSIHWLYGSGFPKSLNVAKAIEAKERTGSSSPKGQRMAAMGNAYKVTPLAGTPDYGTTGNFSNKDTGSQPLDITTDAARQWDGWGTALKPAHEPIVVARKPLIGTVAANVLEHGTGALNIDGCRVGSNPGWSYPNGAGGNTFHGQERRTDPEASTAGRWPANVIVDDTIAELYPEWSNYFYCAKPSKRERNAGLDGLPEKRESDRKSDNKVGGDNPRNRSNASKVNHHPTVKPIALMRYLVRLVTPPNGTVLEPFAGSGTTLMAATLEGFDAIGIELTEDYLPIIEGRIAWAEAQVESVDPTLFDEEDQS